MPFCEPVESDIDWLRITHACVASDLLGAGEEYARRIFEECFTFGRPPQSDDEFSRLASTVGIADDKLIESLNGAETLHRYDVNVREAVNYGAFGVPTFVTEDGQLFFGQDRLVLLKTHLSQ